MSLPEPSPANGFLAEYVQCLALSYQRVSGFALADPTLDPKALACFLYHAPFALVSHDAGEDPVFNYANLTAQRLFEMDFKTFTRLPSRLSAAPSAQTERELVLKAVKTKGYCADYCGVRISRSGKRFRIEQAEIWNVYDRTGAFYGQAARIMRWRFLDA
jgi:hypothetical protein